MMNLHKRPIGLAHFSAIGLSPAELVSAAAKAGFDAVGLRLFPAFPGAPYYAVPQGSDVARDLLQRLGDTGLEVFDIEFVVLDIDFQPRSVLPVLEDAAALGAKRLSVCGQDPIRARLIDNFAALCEVAAQADMSVDLENMGWRPVRSLTDSLDVVQGSGVPNGGLLIDALHVFRNGGTAKTVSALPSTLVRHVQLCDVRGQAPQSNDDKIREARERRFVPGEGDLPLAELVKSLPPDARVSVEVPHGQGKDPKDHLAELMRGSRRVMGIV